MHEYVIQAFGRFIKFQLHQPQSSPQTHFRCLYSSSAAASRVTRIQKHSHRVVQSRHAACTHSDVPVGCRLQHLKNGTTQEGATVLGKMFQQHSRNECINRWFHCAPPSEAFGKSSATSTFDWCKKPSPYERARSSSLVRSTGVTRGCQLIKCVPSCSFQRA